MRMMIKSKLTSKAQTVVPRAVREHLKIGIGDELVYELRDGAVLIRPLRAVDDPFLLFEEWSGDADERAYGKL
jgi:antitoxin PrlF